MTNFPVVMKPVVIALDTTVILDRCWALYGAGAGGSDFRNHQRNYFYKSCRKLLAALATDMFAVADPEYSVHILGDFDYRSNDLLVEWSLKKLDMEDDPDFVPIAHFLLNKFLRLLVRMGFSTMDLVHMSFLTWSGNDMVIRGRFAR